MAQKVQVILVDDIDGGEADETMTFGLDGKTFEIDLSSDKAEKLRGLLAPYTKGGRRIGAARVSSAGSRGKASAKSQDGTDTAVIRAWAKENGFDVNDRGRVPGPVREAYSAAHA
ncbi:Lsr2 family protein [Streptomyces sp. ISL-87]|uniref:histone-like nucleoid-structuring protein Lsr2 n=1 Tax=Streptomyces sp. ISL-87 TaxID=2819188 RepID=UPI001BE95293|nr:Lsr2 family protein [Streptomyces sp. ISL-87]MBT2609898.1 Lsr2 family protein [Streptomyces sp. ISL-87]